MSPGGLVAQVGNVGGFPGFDFGESFTAAVLRQQKCIIWNLLSFNAISIANANKSSERETHKTTKFILVYSFR